MIGGDTDFSDGDYTDLILEDIDDSDSADWYFVHIKNIGDEGDDHGDDGDSVDALTVTFEGGDTEIVLVDGDEEPAISLFGEGGAGHSGKDRTSSSSSGKGGDGGDGGEVTGAQILELEGGSISGEALSAATVTAEGGHGGTGGDGRSYFTSNGKGGDGGNGTNGAEALFSMSDGAVLDITSTADDQPSLYVHSSGGYGGEGGQGRGGDEAKGGDGGDGGDAGTAEISVESGTSLIITTDGDLSHGVEALSEGGDGGDGGKAKDGIFDASGGDGGIGGDAGDVVVSIEDAEITTNGADAIGILARSYGGAGGDGGDADSTFGGGSGGASEGAGVAGDVEVTFGGLITTYGDGESSDDSGSDDTTTSTGILAQSIGGFAGDAGDTEGLLTTWGASSESAGDAGDVTVYVDEAGSVIVTYGSYSAGVEAQSIGGGGGKGGSADAIVAVGGDGSSGGDGGTVVINTESDDEYDSYVLTFGDYSAGISGQSVGGGGGKSGGSSGLATIGGSGGDGGDGGEVVIALDVIVATGGDYSEGVFAQSLGGGGGVGHSTDGLFYQVGGSAGDGGDAGEVEVAHVSGLISTSGIDSDGVEMQSIGGGGGKGSASMDVSSTFSIVVGSSGGDGGNGGEVLYIEGVDDDHEVTTRNSYSAGITAQSGGGGGGHSGNVTTVTDSIGISVTIGSTGDAGSGGDGNTVTVYTSADITTTGAQSDAIFAQSFGGGGGTAGQILSTNSGVDLLDVSITNGGDGGDGGSADAVLASAAGDISTSGDFSYGIYAQSVGGGGGKSSNSYTINGTSLASITKSVGGTGGEGGDGGEITVRNTGSISTAGESASAIFAQSQGGGGGNSGTTFSFDTIELGAVSISVGGDGGNGGSADAVSVTNSGALTTSADDSDGIFAQSLAGGGGKSGSTFSGSGISGADITIALGGDAGDGDTAGTVDIDNSDDISVSGANASAIYAESRGGAGGKAGTVMDVDAISVGAVEIAVGGEGGDGGTASAVTIDNSGDLTVGGENGIGIYATSQGGEGGNSSNTITTEALTADAINVAIGGGGGAGGISADTTVVSSGDITTTADLSYGILAQSIGGAGGNGSTVIDFSGLSILSTATDGIAGDVQVNLGGDGGSGGVSGEVLVQLGGDITTSGDKAYGVLAQSIGGNGGSGGSVYSFNADLFSTTDMNVDVSVGGSGAGGATGNTVYGTSYGDIQTDGLYAHGIFGQSIGGSGGAGGSVTAYSVTTTTEFDLGVSVAVGGEGGDGSVAGDVALTNFGDISTTSEGSVGLYGQSIGGDGGDGGSASTVVLGATVAESDSGTLSVSIAVGGEGGTGNDGGIVGIDNEGSIATTAESSDAIFAQSVGGGGGDGGSAAATAVAFVSGDEDSINLSASFLLELGGSGGSGGDGADVAAVNSGSISTEGDVSYGIFAQSVGGGGGTGGESGSSTSSDSSDIWVEIEDAASDLKGTALSGYSLYSLSQNYSSYFTNWAISVGGSGGAAGDGGATSVYNYDEITTSGTDSTAIYAQSVGGGGGTGGTGTGASITTKAEVGGDGGAGGHGGELYVFNRGDITTSNARANGIWAQSVGGGGGDAGDVEGAFGAGVDDLFSALTDTDDVNFSIDIGANYDGDAGNGGDGGAVTVELSAADLTTTGDSAIGIWAQSVGGGGGTAGSTSLSVYFAGSNGAEGDGGDVDVSLDGGNVSVTGDASVGLFAQSSSGSTYSSEETDDLDSYFEYDGDSSYESGDVTIALNDSSSIAVSGENNRAVMAAATGYSVSGAISLSVDETSSISGENGNAHVISLYDGNTNSIANYGSIEDLDFTDTSRDSDIYVIHTDVSSDGYDSSGTGGQGAVTISNYGTISGSIDLYEDTTGSSFVNGSEGTFNMGSVVRLGEGGGTLSNAGTLSPGGVDELFTTTISGGALDQGEDGILLIDLELNTGADDEEADLIVADSVTDLSGTLEINATGDTNVSDGDSGSVYILVADDLSAEDLSVEDGAIVQYDIAVVSGDITTGGDTYSDTNAVRLSYTIDTSASGASVNTTNLSNYIMSDSSDSLNSSESLSGSAELSSALASNALVFAASPGLSTEDETPDILSSSAAPRDAPVPVADPLSASPEISDVGPSEAEAAAQALFNDVLNADTAEDANRLAAAHVMDETGAALFAARQASRTVHTHLRSCPTLEATNFLREQDCSWVSLIGSKTRFENEAGGAGATVDERSYGLAGGAQRMLDDGLILGAMLQYQDVSLSGTGFDQDGDRLIAGAILKYETGPLTYSLSAALGQQDLHAERAYALSGTMHTATSNLQSQIFSVDAQVAYLQQLDTAYLRWGLGLGLYHTRQDGFTETGDGPLNWSMHSSEETDFVIRPHLEVGTTFGKGEQLGRVFAGFGLIANLTDPENEVKGSLVGLNSNSEMSHVFGYDRYAAELRLGLEYNLFENMRISLRGNGLLSESSRRGELSASMIWTF
ncbi:MAG: hypothetical protein AAGI09_13065 [Pseudomonadota bacterium]